jgi:hypothetical protein
MSLLVLAAVSLPASFASAANSAYQDCWSARYVSSGMLYDEKVGDFVKQADAQIAENKGLLQDFRKNLTPEDWKLMGDILRMTPEQADAYMSAQASAGTTPLFQKLNHLRAQSFGSWTEDHPPTDRSREVKVSIHRGSPLSFNIKVCSRNTDVKEWVGYGARNYFGVETCTELGLLAAWPTQTDYWKGETPQTAIVTEENSFVNWADVYMQYHLVGAYQDMHGGDTVDFHKYSKDDFARERATRMCSALATNPSDLDAGSASFDAHGLKSEPPAAPPAAGGGADAGASSARS